MRFPLPLWCTIVVLAIPIVASPSQDDPPVKAYTARSSPQVGPRTALRLATSHSATLANSTSVPIVNTSVGSFQGTHLELANGSSQDIFYGIPYAQPPVGALRFARPQPVNTTASTVHNNTAPAKECYQPLDYGGVNRTLNDVSEDCLILDVYRPVLGDSGTNGSLLP